MSYRNATPHLPVRELYCDEFRRGPRYTNWRPGGSGDWLLIYTEGGSGRFASPSGPLDTQPGDAVLYAPQDSQDYSTAPGTSEWHLLWVHFTPKPHWHALLHWPAGPGGIRLLQLENGEVREQFRLSMRRMHKLYRREIPGAFELAANALEGALLWAGVSASREPWLTMDARVRKAVDHLIAHLREPFALGDLAAHCGLSVSRLAALFKQETGTSPQQFLERHRMQHASQLLRLTSLTIAEIATEVGFEDPFYFTNRFRRYAGTSPSHFRANGPNPSTNK